MSTEKNLSYPVMETERFIMRNLSIEDVDDIFEYYKDDEVTKYTQSEIHKNIEDTISTVEKLMSSNSNKRGIAWCIEHKADEKVIGNIGIFAISQSGHKAEIGFTVSRKYWGQGYGTEMIQNALKYAIETVGINRIEATCKKENIASSRAMEKAGMKYEGTLRDYSIKDGVYYDVKIYSMIRKDLEN